MDQASSIYVDRFVIEKLVSEKLQRVSHRCSLPAQNAENAFEKFQSINRYPSDIQQKTRKQYNITSAIQTPFEENNVFPLKYRPAAEERHILIFAHGLFEDNPMIYDYLFSQLNDMGTSIYFYTLPFHYERKPNQSLFNGEYFWSVDLMRTIQSIEQAVYDLYQAYNWLERKYPQVPISLAGFSMGGGLVLMLMALCPAIRCAFIINPICTFSENLWSSPLNTTIKKDLLRHNISLDVVDRIFMNYNPQNLPNKSKINHKIGLSYAIYDQISNSKLYTDLALRWQFKTVIALKAGHLNTLRVPRLAQDIVTFISQF